MTKDEKDSLEQALNALERLMRMFQVERLLYLLGGVASLGLFVFAGYRLFTQGVIRSNDLITILGASGVSTACSSRVAYFLNKAFNLVEAIIRKITNTLE
jgi:hypothetical protein